MQIFHEDNFLNKEELSFYINIIHKIFYDNSVKDVESWNHKLWEMSEVFKATEDKESYKKMISLLKKIQEFIRVKSKIDKKLYPDTLQFALKPDGDFLGVHADNSSLNGTPSIAPWREWASVIYLNDDFQGGETFFPDFDYQVNPVPGRIIIFPCDLDHKHGVHKIIGGDRKTLNSFWSRQLINKRLKI